MITLCMDTSQSFLVLALLHDGTYVDGVQETCWKRQSEELFPKLITLLKHNGLSADDIDEIVITKGPGSYTGVRIAMTVAKVFCAMKQVPLYTLGSLQLIAGKAVHARVLMDARGHRAYHAVYDNGLCIEEPSALDIDAIKELVAEDEEVLGDGHLIGREDVWPDLSRNFALLLDQRVKAEQVHTLTPEYLKPSEAYMVKK